MEQKVLNSEVTCEPLKLREKLAYMCGDIASNVIWSGVSGFIMYFYTDVAGIAAATAGLIFLISRIFDGISDILMGVIVDHTKSKHGKARPWLLWMCVPFALSAMALFYVPDIGMTGKIIYAFITYNITSTLIYTAINIPYGAMNALITDRPVDKTSLNVFRSLGSFICGMVMSAIIFPMVKGLGDGSDTSSRGWFLTFFILGIISTLLFLITFFGTKERVGSAVEKREAAPLKKTLPSLVHNKYWLILVGTSILGQLIGGVMSVYPYYAINLLGSSDYVGILSISMMPTLLISMMLIGPIVKKVGKVKTVQYALCISMAGYVLQAFAPTSLPIIIISNALKGFGMGPMSGTGFALISDIIDHEEWRSGYRSEGLVFSASSFGVKIGVGINSVLIGLVLTMGNYQSDVSVQPGSAITAIKVLAIYLPLAFQLIYVLLMSQLKIDKEYPQIIADLHARKQK